MLARFSTNSGARLHQRAQQRTEKIFTLEMLDEQHLDVTLKLLDKEFRSAQTNLKSDTREAISWLRAEVLDLGEHFFGRKESWPIIRRQLLMVFGDRGLASSVYKERPAFG